MGAIITQPAAQIIGTQPEFERSEFNSAIWSKGYNIIVEPAYECPCRSKDAGNQQLSDCQNCGGSGWVFINKFKTRAIMHSMNLDTQYKEWSAENLGTVSVTVRDIDQLSYMDRVTLIDSKTAFHQLLHLQKNPADTQYYQYTIYPVKDIVALFLFSSSGLALEKLELTTDYTIDPIDPRKILIDSARNAQLDGLTDPTLTIRYLHNPQFYVIDLSRDLMNTNVTSSTTGREESLPFPVHAVARRSHYVLEAENFDGNRIIDNDFDVSCE